MINRTLSLGALLLLVSVDSQAGALDAVDFNGRLETRQAVTREGEWGLDEYSALLGSAWQGESGWRLKAQVRALQENKLDGDYHEIEPRELFAEYQGERCTSTVGVQQVV